MKKTFVFFVLCVIIVGSVRGQTPELELPTVIAGDTPSIEEMLNTPGFAMIYEQLHGQKLSRDTLLPPHAITEVPAALPQMLPGIAVQQLEQLDNHKSMLLRDLRNAGTCGYRAAKLAADGEVHTDFQSRRYVPSRSRFDLAIHGDGFFMLHKQGPFPLRNDMDSFYAEIIYFTRAGRFELTDDRKLCLKHHGETYLLQPEIEIPLGADLNEMEWQLARFDRPEQLLRIDGVLFQVHPSGEKPELFHPTALSGTTISTHEYEASNVDVAETFKVYRTLHKMQSAILDAVVF